MKAIKLSVLAAMLLTTGVTTLRAQSADEILEKHAKAMGGAENWDKIKTMKMTGSMSQQGMEIGLSETVLIGTALRMDISLMGMTGFQIVTKNTGYMYMPFGQASAKVDTMKPEMVQMYQKQLDVKGNQRMDYKANGGKAEYVGVDTLNNVPCYKVKFTDKDGVESMSYFDKTTYYLLRNETKLKVDDQEQELATSFANYQKMPEGIVMPMSVTAQGAEITFKTIEVNKPVDEKLFVPTIDKK